MEELSDLTKKVSSKNELLLKIENNEDYQKESVSTTADEDNEEKFKFLAGNSNNTEDEEKFLAGNSNDEPDALPKDPHYRNLDMSMTIISITTYIFDLVSFFSYFYSSEIRGLCLMKLSLAKCFKICNIFVIR